jgi:gentisate 1,2-dioxygenase
MKSSVCDGCPKIMIRDDGVKACWYDGIAIGFLSDLSMGFVCDHYERYKQMVSEKGEKKDGA